MKKILGMVLLFTVITGCGDSIYTPDHKGQIDDNTARIELLEEHAELQEGRLDTLTNALCGSDSINDCDADGVGIIDDLQSQINNIEDKLIDVVEVCGETLLDTEDGLVAYFQSYKNVTINTGSTGSISYTVPEHFVCDRYFGSVCLSGHTEAAQTTAVPVSTSGTATIQVIDDASLTILGEGNYQTTDGGSCLFSVDANGELVGGNQ